MLAVKKELTDLKESTRACVDNEDTRLSNPSSPPDNASAALNNFDETGTMPLATSTINGKASHRNDIDKKLVVDWV